MKVLHISGARSWGGNEQQLMYLLEELPAFGVKQAVFCFKGSPVEKEAKLRNAEVFAIKKAKPFSSEYRKALRDILNDAGIDLIHLHTSDSVTGFVVADLFKKIQKPVVFAKKGIREKNSWLSKYKYNYKNIDKILCVSEYVKDHFAEILKPKSREKLLVVNDGIKIDEQATAPFLLREKLEIPSQTFIFGSIANHTKAKDLKTLIHAVKRLEEIQPGNDFHLVQIGSFSKLTPELKQEVEEQKLEKKISFLGFVPEASAFLGQFDAVVISSGREGGPSTLMEAFAAGTPVVSTKVGVVEEAIENGKNGFYTAPGDANGLAEKMAAVMEDPELRQRFSQLSKEIFRKKFTAGHLAQNTYSIYKDLLEK